MTFHEFLEIITKEFPHLTQEQKSQFERMYELYMDWNSKINVISRKDTDQLYRHHILHSLCIAAYLKKNRPDVFDRLVGEGVYAAAKPLKILDLGTGGGFPGIPLAVMFPKGEFTLCDSIGKKIIVAGGVAESLGLKNAKAVNARAESLPETFDFVVSRAVTSLENFLPWVKGKFSEGILYLKGGDLDEEITLATKKFHINPQSVKLWKISDWLDDEFFETKMVVAIDRF